MESFSKPNGGQPAHPLSRATSDFDTSFAKPIVLADNLPPSTTSLEVTIPAEPFQPTNINQFIRIVAIDRSGQQDWDQTPLIVPTGNISGDIRITSNYSGKTFIGGHPAPPITWTGSANGGNTEAFIFLESDGGLVSLFGGNATLPILSTDTARLAILSSTNSNDTLNGSFLKPIFPFARTLGWDCKLQWYTSMRQPTGSLSPVEESFPSSGRLPHRKDCDRLTSRFQLMAARLFIRSRLTLVPIPAVSSGNYRQVAGSLMFACV